jgi:hypothetical protein
LAKNSSKQAFFGEKACLFGVFLVFNNYLVREALSKSSVGTNNFFLQEGMNIAPI